MWFMECNVIELFYWVEWCIVIEGCVYWVVLDL